MAKVRRTVTVRSSEELRLNGRLLLRRRDGGHIAVHELRGGEPGPQVALCRTVEEALREVRLRGELVPGVEEVIRSTFGGGGGGRGAWWLTIDWSW